MHLYDRYTAADYASFEDFIAGYALTVPARFNFSYDVIDEMARLAPNQRAMIWTDESGDERIFTFADFKHWSDKTANFLRAQGLKKGDPVLLMLKRRYEYWFLALALMKIGCVQIPATHQLQTKDIVYRINAASAKFIVCVNEPEVTSSVKQAAQESGEAVSIATLGPCDEFIDFTAGIARTSADFAHENPVNDNDDMMLMYFTSGTTGMPKMAAHDFTYPLGHIITAKFWHHLDDSSIHLTVADTGWAKCGWGKIYGQWLCGSTIFVYDYDKFNAPNLLKLIEKYGITSFCAPPTIYRFMTKGDLSSYDLTSLRSATVAGEPLNPEVYDQFLRVTGLSLREGFGQTETTPMLLTPYMLKARPGSMGKPSPHYDIRLLGEDGQSVEVGEEGEICVSIKNGRPAGLFTGYYRSPALTEAAFLSGVYHTGDMAWCDEDGYYWFIGRADDVIKSSGYRIGPFEVESALIEHPTVLECAITGVPDPDRGQIVKATIVLTKGHVPSDALKKELQNHVKRVTAPYKYPRIIEFVEELPKTFSGKIRRGDIRVADIAAPTAPKLIVRRYNDAIAKDAHSGTIRAHAVLPKGAAHASSASGSELSSAGALPHPFDSAWGYLPGPYGELEPHAHPTDEIYIVFKGAGVVTVAGESAEVGNGDVIEIPANALHNIKNVGTGELLWLAFWWMTK